MGELLKQYDDLVTTSNQEELAPDEYGSVTESEAAKSGWVILCLVFDDDGHILLVKQSCADGWMVPGGARKNEESLRETAAREVKEETGVVITPTRPYRVHDHTVKNAETGETTGWRNVYFGGIAEKKEIRDDTGLEDEEISNSEWFDSLADDLDLYNPELLEELYERVYSHLAEG